MTRTVACRKYGEELEGLETPPLPGPAGEEIFNTVSKRAWLEWQNLQTMLINEKTLDLRDPEARKYLTEQREKFLNNEATDHATGYVPQTDD
ncbi:MAG: oxidative damage protection protein [Gammaproteobacteria bacterium]|jgi:Fe-S cluster biosynthesis and repair protein YggX|nr:MAG: oxidative damage protection protein [Gammaproteobacteria bacterium]